MFLGFLETKYTAACDSSRNGKNCDDTLDGLEEHHHTSDNGGNKATQGQEKTGK